MSAAAHANPSVTPNTQDSTAIQVQHVYGSSYKLHLRDMPAYKGDYSTNAGHMRVSLTKNKLYAQIGDEEKSELMPVAPNVFVTRGEQTKVVFDPPELQ